ncbi:MAG TPA: acyl-CoA dehydrogenase [Streptosporangiaceae bacterium]|nr:acyl-CoA dehydrogenase [Streptosporangiaceae bacterium]
MPIAQSPEQLALAESVGQWAKRAGTIAAVRGLEKGGPRSAEHWAGHWASLAELGIFAIGVPEDCGGSGGTAADVAVVAEQLAAALVPGPVMPTLLAALVLAETARSAAPGGSAAQALLPRVASGAAAVAVAMSASGLTGVVPSGGGLRVSGTARLVPGAGAAPYLLLGAATEVGETWFLAEPARPGVHLARRTPVDFSRPLADVTLDEVLIEPDRVLGGLRDGLVVDLAATLAAAEASGVAAWCCQTAAEHARTRQQFGRPIGSFQAVKHLCAFMLCRSELTTAAAWDAARAVGESPDEHPLAAAAAAVLALDAAVDNAKDCIQVLGGIGFTWAHDAHLYLRRAVSLRTLLGGSSSWRARAAELALEGMRRHPFDDAGSLDDGEPADAGDIRSAARLVASAVSAMPPGDRRGGLAEVGYVAPAWPPPYGVSASPAAQLIIDEELARAGLARPDIGIGGWAIPAILAHGSTDQLARFAGPTLRGEITWCQLFSEPEAGSDLASLRTRAVRVDGDGQRDAGWKLTGQKVWTSLAGQADWAICLARTDPAAPKHKGITFFIVSMHDPGIEVRPLREITGLTMFNEVFLDDVFVPDALVVGEPGEGWRVARTTLATERVAMVRGAGLSEDVEALLTAVRQGPIANPMVIDQIGLRLAEGLALAVMDDRIAAAVARGGEAGMMAAVRKLLGVAHRQSVAETALTLCGVEGAASDGNAAGQVHEFLLVRCLSIAGGTSQILLSLVAERMLGLPRDEAR